jgi:hypothetical protein
MMELRLKQADFSYLFGKLEYIFKFILWEY